MLNRCDYVQRNLPLYRQCRTSATFLVEHRIRTEKLDWNIAFRDINQHGLAFGRSRHLEGQREQYIVSIVCSQDPAWKQIDETAQIWIM